MICIYIYNIYVYRHIHHWKHQNIVGSGNFDYLLSHPFYCQGIAPAIYWLTLLDQLITGV